jgi:hypothetical protein
MLLEETNASGVAQADYIYLNGRPVAVLNGSTIYFLHDDRLGTLACPIFCTSWIVSLAHFHMADSFALSMASLFQ